MPKFNLSRITTFTVTPIKGVGFSKKFLDSISKILTDVGTEVKLGDTRIQVTSLTKVLIQFNVPFADGKDIQPFSALLMQRLTLVTSHGPDTDLFDALMERHPGLRGHPKFDHVVRAWDNLMSKAKEVGADNSPATKALLQKAEREGTPTAPDIPESNTSYIPEDKVSHREQSLIGQAATQQVTKEGPREAVIPVKYDELKKDTSFDGNIMQ